MAEYSDNERLFVLALMEERKAEKELEAAQKKMSTDNSANGHLVATATAALTNAKKALHDILK